MRIIACIRPRIGAVRPISLSLYLNLYLVLDVCEESDEREWGKWREKGWNTIVLCCVFFFYVSLAPVFIVFVVVVEVRMNAGGAGFERVVLKTVAVSCIPSFGLKVLFMRDLTTSRPFSYACHPLALVLAIRY